ncbi:unnamed protein product [Adineta ricciae]|uniref:Uncharacterized protein n=1 Tax=Adineta ricciae TaxID=249248 RepID=A0A815GQZ0_ADIRI|nr:unnamed protein product [Adineta ricciae]CAF1532176.1 unnamed protein product [Adineta ricciae]
MQRYHCLINRFEILSKLSSKSRSSSPLHSSTQKLPSNMKCHHRRHRNSCRLSTSKVTNDTYNHKDDNDNKFKGIILSDSMCSRIRTYMIKKFNLIDIELSYESGCDIYKMIKWFRTHDGINQVTNKDFIVFSLGTNDVARHRVDISLERCSEIISFIRQSFSNIRAIDIGDFHRQFNERLQILSKQLDFDVVDACLGSGDMRVEDGLHPSTTGQWKYEQALRSWFISLAASHSLFLENSLAIEDTAVVRSSEILNLTLYENDENKESEESMSSDMLNESILLDNIIVDVEAKASNKRFRSPDIPIDKKTRVDTIVLDSHESFRKTAYFDQSEFLLWLKTNQHLRTIDGGPAKICELLDKLRIENPALDKIFISLAENNEKVNPHSFDVAQLVLPNDSIILPSKWKHRTDSGATYI